MLTEKAIADSAFCAYLWTDTPGNKKRKKPDRDSEDDVIERIHNALTTGVANKRVYPEKTFSGTKATPYDGDFWLVITVENTDLLLTLSEVNLLRTQEEKPIWTIKAQRNQQRKPRTKEGEAAEMHVLWILAYAFREHFNHLQVELLTKYPGESVPTAKAVIPATGPTPEGLVAIRNAFQHFEQLRREADGEKSLVPRTENCPQCWWRDCPVRVRTVPVGPTTGVPEMEIL